MTEYLPRTVHVIDPTAAIAAVLKWTKQQETIKNAYTTVNPFYVAMCREMLVYAPSPDRRRAQALGDVRTAEDDAYAWPQIFALYLALRATLGYALLPLPGAEAA